MAKQRTAEMPFLDHLEELRWRLIWSLLALVVGISIALVLVLRVDALAILQQPIAPYLQGHKLVFTNPSDAFMIVMKVAIGIGIVLALPVVLYQLWAFVAPALYPHEKRLVIPVIVGAVALFAAGVGIAYFYILPYTLGFLINFQSGALEPMITADAYFGFAVGMSLAFGAVFELPIVILALTAIGLVTPAMLRRFRRYAVVLSAVAGAIITPGGDFMTLAALSVPIYGLYEVSVLLSFLVHRRRERRAAREAALEAEREAERGQEHGAPA
ncbi:MAG TPA: twin-arginine translocase subunit TatC [Gemmatimonadaceae bacterium]|nr:twin-arginine translocase subunit TatC [Gemmatimonadaceae bacterium]